MASTTKYISKTPKSAEFIDNDEEEHGTWKIL
ncbi:MAG: hypothetical protein ACI9FJ_002648 [Alteromonadaceae bacterium]|jgi:hypothetical protein